MSENTDHVYLDLRDDEDDPTWSNPHRPRMSVYVEYPDEKEKLDGEQAKVVVHLAAMWGQPTRWIEMSNDEARKFIEILDAARTLLVTEYA